MGTLNFALSALLLLNLDYTALAQDPEVHVDPRPLASYLILDSRGAVHAPGLDTPSPGLDALALYSPGPILDAQGLDAPGPILDTQGLDAPAPTGGAEAPEASAHSSTAPRVSPSSGGTASATLATETVPKVGLTLNLSTPSPANKTQDDNEGQDKQNNPVQRSTSLPSLPTVQNHNITSHILLPSIKSSPTPSLTPTSYSTSIPPHTVHISLSHTPFTTSPPDTPPPPSSHPHTLPHNSSSPTPTPTPTPTHPSTRHPLQTHSPISNLTPEHYETTSTPPSAPHTSLPGTEPTEEAPDAHSTTPRSTEGPDRGTETPNAPPSNPSSTLAPFSSSSAQAEARADNPSQLNMGGDAAVVHEFPALDPLLAGLVSAFVITAVIVSLLLFLKLRRRDNRPEFRRLQDLPMDDMMEDTPLSMYSY